MTTLAYSRKENVIAVDSRMTSDDIVQSDKFEKWLTGESGDIYFIVGCVSDAKRLMEAVESGCDEMDDTNAVQANLVRVSGEPCIIGVDSGFLFYDKLDDAEFRALGTGQHFALAALDLGKTAKQAVEYAMTRDIYSGGKVVQYDLTRQRFKK